MTVFPKHIRMTPEEKNDFYRELFSLAIPIGLQSLLTSLIGATDALMLGRLSQDAVSAVALANQIQFIMNLFISAVVNAGGILIAQYLGKADRVMAKNLFCMTLKWSCVISAFFFALTMLVPRHLMRLFTPDEVLIHTGASYLQAVSFSYLFSGLARCYYLKMKIEGKAARSVTISIAVLVTDMLLDAFLIYGLAGAPKLGANGSAYSTVAVELLALCWCIAESYQKGSIRADRQGLRWHSARITKDWLTIVSSSLGSSLAWGLSVSMHSFLMGHLGSDATAAASITSVVQDLIFCVCRGISAGAGIIIGKLLGQNLFDKARLYGRKFCHLSLAAGAVHTLLLALAGPAIAAMFVLTETARHYLTAMLIFAGFFVFAYAVNTVVVIGIFPAGGDTRYNAVSVFIATWCFALPIAAAGTFLFHWHPVLVYVVMCLDEIVKAPFLYPRYRKYIWLRNLTESDP